MTREELMNSISALHEGKARRFFSHVSSGHALGGSALGDIGGRAVGAGPLADRGLRRRADRFARAGQPDLLAPIADREYRTMGGAAGKLVGSYGGLAGGALASRAAQGKDILALDTAKDPVAAGKKYAKKHQTTAAFILPKNKTEMKKLAKRSTLGHIGHGALRMAVAGPWNTARYATKVSYARSGYHRNEDVLDISREELIEAILAEGQWRRLGTHYGSPAELLVGAAGIPALGTGINYALAGKDVHDLDTAKDPVVAGKKYAKKRALSAAFVLPKNKTEMKKLAKRSTLGHIGHGALRSLGGPWNTARYATKVSYARSGYHRGE